MLLRGTLYVRFCDILTLYCLLSLWTSGDIHLFGHLHQLGGLVPDIYVLSDEGHLELELADWMENRMWGPLSPSCLRFLLALYFRLMWSFCACQLHSWVCRLCFCCRPAAAFVIAVCAVLFLWFSFMLFYVSRRDPIQFLQTGLRY